MLKMHPIINQFSRVVCLPPVFFSLSLLVARKPKVHNINIKIHAAFTLSVFFLELFRSFHHQSSTEDNHIKPAIAVIAVNVSYSAYRAPHTRYTRGTLCDYENDVTINEKLLLLGAFYRHTQSRRQKHRESSKWDTVWRYGVESRIQTKQSSRILWRWDEKKQTKTLKNFCSVKNYGIIFKLWFFSSLVGFEKQLRI